ncbi:MAG: PAS domain-containing protein [Deltaproteobacteria bacterium]|nr:PAS domain-containing protein [Deltaproteobacteria bacterium]
MNDERPDPPSATDNESEATSLFVVGIAASAGGIDALERFFSYVEPGHGLAYLVVQHMERHHQSLLPELLANHNDRLKFKQAASGDTLDADVVYVIAPGTRLTLAGDVLSVSPLPAEETIPLTADALFVSLAVHRGTRAVGIVLSGTGTDGTAGLQAIKASGGMTYAQAPDTAQSDGMPSHAVQSGAVDAVLPVEAIFGRLVQQTGARGAATTTRVVPVPLDGQIHAALDAICTIVHRKTGHDFGRYKAGTLARRVRRRLQATHHTSVAEYVAALESSADEVEQLLRDLLIRVTKFFRDPEAFLALEERVFAEIVQPSRPDRPIRLWVPGCATGQEAYSLAIQVWEQLARRHVDRQIQIFATDIDTEALAIARAGRYDAEELGDLTPERREQFFAPEGDTWRVAKELRDMCIFSAQNLVRDPPFSSLDLISCRNVLIYMQPEIQKRLVPLFHYALRPGGYLFLGPSEGLASCPELFDIEDKPHRIFRRKEMVSRPAFEFPLTGRRAARFVAGGAPASEPGAAVAPSPTDAFERMLLEEYVPASAIVNELGEILYLAGRTGRYLQQALGAPSNNLLHQARGGLRRELRAALSLAVETRRRVVSRAIGVETEDGTAWVRLTVRPVPGLVPTSGMFAVIIQDIRPADESAEAARAPEAELPMLEQLESELRSTRAELQSTVEELESANEELKSSNEELISTNEELQSSNEELQTSQEELRSVNEELANVNSELEQRVSELHAANADLHNLFVSTQVATLFLDRNLRITKFTPAAVALFHLLDSDVGRPIADLVPRFVGMDVLADVRQVLSTLRTVERQVQTSDGSGWFMVRSLPYRTLDNVVSGVVVTFVDVTALKLAEETAQRQVQLLHMAFDAILVWRIGGGIELWNRGCEEIYGYYAQEAIGRESHDLLQTTYPRPWSEIEAELRERRRWEGEFVHRTKDGRAITTSVKLQFVPAENGAARVLEINRDITERKRTQEALQHALEEAREGRHLLQAMLDHLPLGLTIAEGPELRVRHVSRFGQTFIGRTREELEVLPGEGRARLLGLCRPGNEQPAPDEELPLSRAAHQGEVITGEEWAITHRNGERLPILCTAAPVYGEGTGITGAIVAWQDMRLLKRLEQEMLNIQKLESIRTLAAGIAHDFNNLLTGVLGGISLASAGLPDSHPLQEFLAGADEACRSATGLTQQLLTFSRGAAPVRQPVDLAQLVAATLELVLRGSRVRADVSATPDLRAVMADRAQIAQVIQNLVINAVQAMPDGGVARLRLANATIEASHGMLAPGNYVCLSVQDQGPGIAPQHLEKIFTPFFSTKPQGAGLGLAVVYSIAKNHGGRVEVESEPGRGSCFRVFLPATDETAIRAEPGEASSVAGGGLAILVMDDEVAVRRVASQALRRAGYEVTTALDGAEAVECFAKAHAHGRSYAAVILDLTVPGGMGGREVAQRILALDPKARLIVSSGYAEDLDITEFARHGFCGALTKPYDASAICAAVANVLKQEGS